MHRTHPAAASVILFVNDMADIPRQAPICLEVIRLRGVHDVGTSAADRIDRRGYEAMVGGWAVQWQRTPSGIADALHRQMPWLREQRPPGCASSTEQEW